MGLIFHLLQDGYIFFDLQDVNFPEASVSPAVAPCELPPILRTGPGSRLTIFG